jgi:hypothetical protein
MIGDKYIEDKNRIYVTIVYTLNYSVTNINFKTELDNNPIAGGWGQNSNSFIIKYERKISEKLFNNLSKGINNLNINLIFGYFNGILPKINEEIFKLKYLSGHILCRPVSKFDVTQIVIIKNATNEHINISGSYNINNSALSLSLKEENNHIFIRDYVDAMTSFLFNNYDDCIRKIITSLENFFLQNKFGKIFVMNLKKLTKGDYSPPEWKIYMPILYDNMLFIFKVRNKMIHENLRVNYDALWFEVCGKAIDTLQYLYQNSFNNDIGWKYFVRMSVQFHALIDSSRIMNLDELEKSKANHKKDVKVLDVPPELKKESNGQHKLKSRKIIDVIDKDGIIYSVMKANPELDEFQFKAITISKEIQNAILKLNK